MKTLITIIALISALQIHAQITAGRITYETEIKNPYTSDYFEDEKSDYSASDTITTSSSYAVDFNERYVRTFIGMNEFLAGYILIKDKSAGKTFFATLDEEKKTIRFLDFDIDDSESGDDDSGYYDDYGDNYEDYYDDKPHLDKYHENFYQELMKIQLNDTIVVTTDETKEILGFTCQKYILKIKDQVITLWTTDKIVGMEQTYHLPKQVKGVVMELYMKSKNESIHTTATVFSTQTTLTEGNINFMPEGYQLNLGSLYLDSYSFNDYYESSLSLNLPSFIESPDYIPVLKAICKEVNNVISPSGKKDGYAFADFTIIIDEKGKIVDLVELDNYTSAHIDFDKLKKNVTKKCSFKQPFKLNGNPVSSSLSISYSYSNYNYNEEGY